MTECVALEGPVIFVSDVHLRHGDGPYLEQFLRFLQRDAARAKHLIIHGDLFEFYVGPKQSRASFYAPLRAAFTALHAGGTEIQLIHGNRDYLLRDCFADCGVTLAPLVLQLRLGDLKVRVSHGDELCIHDRAYQFWGRRVLRWPPLQWIFRRLPLSMGTLLARRYRRISAARHARRGHQNGRLATMLDGARSVAHGWDVLICGHIHQPATTQIGTHDHPCALWTTGAWEDGPNHILWNSSAFCLVRAS